MFDVHHHHSDHLLREVLAELKGLNRQGAAIMTKIEQANAALAEIDAATTEQGALLEQQGEDLLNISADVDRLVEAAKEGALTPELIAKAEAVRDRVKLHGTKLSEQAAFSKAVAGKVGDPVPVPVPEPVPAPPADTPPA